MVIPFSCPQARGILSQLNKWPHDQYLKENEQHVQGKLNSPFSDPFLLDSTENWYLGRISESFAVGKYSWGPNGVWSSENGGYNSGRKAWVAVMDGSWGWVSSTALVALCTHSAAELSRSQTSHRGSTSRGDKGTGSGPTVTIVLTLQKLKERKGRSHAVPPLTWLGVQWVL